MTTLCAWCAPVDDPRHSDASHTICATCAASWLHDDHGRPVAPVADNATYERPAGPWDLNGE